MKATLKDGTVVEGTAAEVAELLGILGKPAEPVGDAVPVAPLLGSGIAGGAGGTGLDSYAEWQRRAMGGTVGPSMPNWYVQGTGSGCEGCRNKPIWTVGPWQCDRCGTTYWPMSITSTSVGGNTVNVKANGVPGDTCVYTCGIQ